MFRVGLLLGRRALTIDRGDRSGSFIAGRRAVAYPAWEAVGCRSRESWIVDVSCRGSLLGRRALTAYCRASFGKEDSDCDWAPLFGKEGSDC